MKRAVLRALSIPAATLEKGLLVPAGATVVTVRDSGYAGKVDVILAYEIDIEEEKKG